MRAVSLLCVQGDYKAITIYFVKQEEEKRN